VHSVLSSCIIELCSTPTTTCGIGTFYVISRREDFSRDTFYRSPTTRSVNSTRRGLSCVFYPNIIKISNAGKFILGDNVYTNTENTHTYANTVIPSTVQNFQKNYNEIKCEILIKVWKSINQSNYLIQKRHVTIWKNNKHTRKTVNQWKIKKRKRQKHESID